MQTLKGLGSYRSKETGKPEPMAFLPLGWNGVQLGRPPSQANASGSYMVDLAFGSVYGNLQETLNQQCSWCLCLACGDQNCLSHSPKWNHCHDSADLNAYVHVDLDDITIFHSKAFTIPFLLSCKERNLRIERCSALQSQNWDRCNCATWISHATTWIIMQAQKLLPTFLPAKFFFCIFCRPSAHN